MKRGNKLICLLGVCAALAGCSYEQGDFNKVINVVVYALGIIALGVLLFFIVMAIISSVYKGKAKTVTVLKKKEFKFKQRKGFSMRGSKINARYSRSKVTVEIDGKNKVLTCNDNVILDKLSIGKKHNLRIRFNTIVKILK